MKRKQVYFLGILDVYILLTLEIGNCSLWGAWLSFLIKTKQKALISASKTRLKPWSIAFPVSNGSTLLLHLSDITNYNLPHQKLFPLQQLFVLLLA